MGVFWDNFKYPRVHVVDVMRAKAQTDDGRTEADNDSDYEPEYGDVFEHIVTREEHIVQSAYDGKVTWVDGGWDPIDELVSAVDDDQMSMYEPVALGADVYEGEGY